MKTSSTLVTVWVAVALLCSGNALAAEEFARGHGALEIFGEGAFAALPPGLKLWLSVMVATFLAGLVFVRTRPAARRAVGGFLVSLATGHAVFGALGLPMLGGSIAIWHLVCWTPALALLLTQHPFLKADEGRWYRVWSGAMTCVILISFVFDTREAAIYIDHFTAGT